MDWFHQLLTQLEIEQDDKYGEMDRFLNIHIYVTSAPAQGDIRSVGLQLALDTLYKQV